MKINNPGAYLDHMMRQSRQHHVQLSSMADLKANMLLTVSSVVVTLAIPHVLKEHFTIPLLILIVSCLVTMGLAAYAVMPKLPLSASTTPKPDVHDPRFNILFFGDFTRLDYKEFSSAMEDIMNDPSKTYEAQVRELYTLGTFLAAKKYRMLRLAYMSLMTGLVASFTVLLLSLF